MDSDSELSGLCRFDRIFVHVRAHRSDLADRRTIPYGSDSEAQVAFRFSPETVHKFTLEGSSTQVLKRVARERKQVRFRALAILEQVIKASRIQYLYHATMMHTCKILPWRRMLSRLPCNFWDMLHMNARPLARRRLLDQRLEILNIITMKINKRRSDDKYRSKRFRSPAD